MKVILASLIGPLGGMLVMITSSTMPTILSITLYILCTMPVIYLFWFLIKSPLVNARLYIQMSQIIITNKCVVFQGNILELNKFSHYIKNFGDVFYKSPFEEFSRKKLSFFKKIGGLGGVFGIRSLKNELSQGLYARTPSTADVFYTKYIALPFVLFIFGVIFGVFLLMVRLPLGIIFTILLKFITFFTHYTENRINSLFTAIEKSSNILQSQKQKLLDSLENGTGFYDFQKVFTLLSKSVDSSINNSQKLEKLLKGSKFHDIFDFEVYHSWIRKQVREPLEQILSLMEDNLQILIKTKIKLTEQISQTIDHNLRAPLELQLVRMDEQIGGFEKNRPILREYLEKLSK